MMHDYGWHWDFGFGHWALGTWNRILGADYPARRRSLQIPVLESKITLSNPVT